MASVRFNMLGCSFFKRNQLKECNRKLIFSGIFIGFWLFVGYATQTAGLLFTTSSKAGFITGLSVVLVPLFSLLLLKQKPSKNAILGIVVATAGLYLLTMTDSVSLTIGDGLVFICAIAFALQIIFTGKYSSKLSNTTFNCYPNYDCSDTFHDLRLLV